MQSATRVKVNFVQSSNLLFVTWQTFSEALDVVSQLKDCTQGSSGSDYVPENTQDSLDSFAASLSQIDKSQIQSLSLRLMRENSQLFMGVHPESAFIIQKLADVLGSHDSMIFEVMLTLRRVRLNEVFELIALYMGVSLSHASAVFRRTLPTVAACLKELVINVSKPTSLRNLPIAFRMHYSNVTHILDCYEIQIQTPSNSIHRAVTWSSYKGCPTLKYLISITPDGFCNFVSRGYGGRNSDIGITHDSGLLDMIPRGSSVLADRGFKSLESALDTRGVTLHRPPSVFKGKHMTKEECDNCRKVASVRIHVERFIGWLRNFQSIAPHSTVPIKMIPMVDLCVEVACGLTNLGVPLIAGNTLYN